MKRGKETAWKNFIKKYGLRSLICLVLIFSLFTVPAMTEAKYKAVLNDFTVLRAGEYYFTSNLLKPSEASYFYSGWDGQDNTELMKVQLRNYENTLLANQTGQDVKYKLDWSMTYYNKNGNPETDKYQLVVKSDGNTIESSSVNGEIPGTGDPAQKSYTVAVNKLTDDNVDPEVGAYIEIQMSAENSSSMQFYRKLSAVFRYYISTDKEFVKSFNLTQNDKVDDSFYMEIGTDSVPGMSVVSRTIQLWWDEDYMKVYPFDTTFDRLTRNDPTAYSEVTVTVGGTSKKYKVLTITGVQSYSSYKIEFRKTDHDFWKDSTNGVGNLTIGSNIDPTLNHGGLMTGYYLEPISGGTSENPVN